jgi:hypothetical protein
MRAAGEVDRLVDGIRVEGRLGLGRLPDLEANRVAGTLYLAVGRSTCPPAARISRIK